MEIIDSDIYLVRKEQAKEIPKEEYASVNLEEILQIRAELSEYMSYLVLPGDDGDTECYDDYEPTII